MARVCCVECASKPSTMGDVYGDCDSFQVVLTADPVLALRARIDGEYEATDAAVRACAALSPEERALWSAKLASWREAKKVDPNAWGLGANGQFRIACAFGKDLEAWRAILAQKCGAVGPSKVVAGEHDEWTGPLKWAAVAAASIGVVYALTLVAPALKAAARARSKRS